MIAQTTWLLLPSYNDLKSAMPWILHTGAIKHWPNLIIQNSHFSNHQKTWTSSPSPSAISQHTLEAVTLD